MWQKNQNPRTLILKNQEKKIVMAQVGIVKRDIVEMDASEDLGKEDDVTVLEGDQNEENNAEVTQKKSNEVKLLTRIVRHRNDQKSCFFYN